MNATSVGIGRYRFFRNLGELRVKNTSTIAKGRAEWLALAARHLGRPGFDLRRLEQTVTLDGVEATTQASTPQPTKPLVAYVPSR